MQTTKNATGQPAAMANRRRFISIGAAAGLAGTMPWAFAQDSGGYPKQPIRIVVPFAAGSGTDAVARITGQMLGDALKGSVIVDNKAGANGVIAAEAVAKAPPDGYTLFMTTNTTHSANPSLMKSLPYDPVKDFAPVSRMGNLPFMLVVNNELPVKNVAELLAWGRAHPGKLTYASGNSTGIVCGATLSRMSGVPMLHVPYKSTPPAIADLIGGQVSMMVVDLAAGLATVKAGKMRAIAVTTQERTKLFPELPPLADTPELKGFDITSWNGVFAPAGTPREIVRKLNKVLADMANGTVFRERVAKLGFDAFGSTPEELGAFTVSELAKWKKLIQAAGIQPE
ncbi:MULTISPECIES: Bug family tripartite tricarboxylate transporter substrate binding protein [Variovorax]|jgi:tripartite-type tricarboxylate transporter receptor subunit TctC|uniref:Bug family tripartite tricarboxylate transporter substrate binding protein n=1 Tax=Variovorax TaxID=34072 RepID=UPI00086E4FC4|nr:MULTISPECIES: tripartite tricarboxylate transporter substrate binding protein [Variovorax]MBN8752728.1 tripartite tricarboxylate transporter substrate binding protein [Variovorax sp.]ODU16196.1 MAG: ABC transporter substrate-binding protein [Variovorax sp. SCN 67-85]OJZ10318.1 MAG: ABC transporter substrate-binding protein [Variovorax sp. 67-131]UKI06953.1 tripartite tricarboxylate transporter substrate binding protein [Variovorax paradoxus]